MASKTTVSTDTSTSINTTAWASANSTARPRFGDYGSFVTTALNTVLVVYSLTAALIIATCLLLCIIVLSSPALRSSLRNQLLLSLAVSYLLVGTLGLPFMADFAASGFRWRHGCVIQVVAGLVSGFIQNFVSQWTIVLMMIHYVFRVQRYEGPAWLVRLPALLRRALPGLILATPWVLAVVVNVPMAFSRVLTRGKSWTIDDCPFFMSRNTDTFLSVTSFYLPAVALIALSVAAVVLYRRRGADCKGSSAARAEMGAGLVESTDDLEPPLAYVVTAVLAVVILLPEYLLRAMYFLLRKQWKTRFVLYWVSNSLNEMLPFIHAIVWMVLFRDVRQRLLELAAMLPCRSACCQSRSPPQSSGASSVPPVTFRDLRED